MLLIILLFTILHVGEGFEEEDDRTNWVDPNDPSVRRVPYTEVGNHHELGRIEYKIGISDDPTLRLILRDLFVKLNVDPLQKTSFSRKARLSLSSYSMHVISSYLESDEHDNELALREKIRTALKNMVEVLDEDDYVSTWDSFFSIIQPWISMLNMVILPVAFFFVLHRIMSTRSFWIMFISSIFLLSMVSTYSRMYQEKLAARLAVMASNQGDVCASGGLFQQSLEFIKNLVVFKKKSQCLTFVESQTVSIITEISLMDVFSDVVSNSIFGVLGSLGHHTNRFFRAFYDEVPLPAMLLMTVTLIFTTVRISTPLFTFEPLLLTVAGHVFGTFIQYANGPYNQAPEGLKSEERPAMVGGNFGDQHHQSIQNSANNLPAITLNKRTFGKREEFHDPDSSPFVTKRTPERQKNMRRNHIPGVESDSTGSRSSSLDSSYSRGRVSDALDSRDGGDFLKL